MSDKHERCSDCPRLWDTEGSVCDDCPPLQISEAHNPELDGDDPASMEGSYHPEFAKVAAPALPAVEDGSGKFFGIWPGNETDEQLLAAIDEIRKPDVCQAETIGQLQTEVAVLRGEDCEADGDGPCGVCLKCCRRYRAKIEQQAETIRQMTELLREYRGWMKNAGGCDIYYGIVPNGSDQRCLTCIKADLLLKENK